MKLVAEHLTVDDSPEVGEAYLRQSKTLDARKFPAGDETILGSLRKLREKRLSENGKTCEWCSEIVENGHFAEHNTSCKGRPDKKKQLKKRKVGGKKLKVDEDSE